MCGKWLPCVGWAVVWSLFLSRALHAEDVGWLQSGVRVWYNGGTGGAPDAIPNPSLPSSNAQEADLIAVVGGQVHVIQQAAVANWTSPMAPADLLCPAPTEEGPFWISPSRLKAIQPGIGTGVVNWLGTDRVVYARTTYTYDTVPFLRLLPVKALFALSPVRELVVLQNASSGDTVGDYYFDLETGLLLSKTEQLAGYGSTTLTISEINYDFAVRQAFPEDRGPHSGYAGFFQAGSRAFLDNASFQIVSQVISRYGTQILTDLQSNFGNVTTNQYVFLTNYLHYDAATQTASIRSQDKEDWATNGDHLFWWIPPADRALGSITVWNLALPNQGSAGVLTTFTAVQPPTDSAFTSLTFDEGGFLADLTVCIPAMAININSAMDPARIIRIDGRSFYETSMTPGIPSGVPIGGGTGDGAQGSDGGGADGGCPSGNPGAGEGGEAGGPDVSAPVAPGPCGAAVAESGLASMLVLTVVCAYRRRL